MSQKHGHGHSNGQKSDSHGKEHCKEEEHSQDHEHIKDDEETMAYEKNRL